MITCPRSERLVALLHDSELDGPLRREMASHVAVCVSCTRALSTLERVQELVRQATSEEAEDLDFADFWEGVASKLNQPEFPPWRLRLRLWREKWRAVWPFSPPVWAAATAILFITTFLVSRTPPPKNSASVSQETPPPVFVAKEENDQAQIESLSVTATVSLWNEPESNTTVIWVNDDDGGMP